MRIHLAIILMCMLVPCRSPANDVVRVLAERAADHQSKSRYDESAGLYRAALAVGRTSLAKDPLLHAEILRALASATIVVGTVAEAGALVTRAMDLLARVPARSPERYRILIYAGLIAAYRGDGERAQALMNRAATVTEEIHGRRSPEYAMILVNLSDLELHRKQWPAAAALCEEGLKLLDEMGHQDSLDAAYLLSNLADALQEQNALIPAQNASRSAVSIAERKSGPRGVETAAFYVVRARVLRKSGMLPVAETLARLGVRIATALTGERGPEVAKGLSELGKILSLRGKVTEARDCAARAQAIVSRSGMTLW